MPSQEPPRWRDWIEQGAAAFWKARHSEAVAAFQKAADANPRSSIPHLYLALGWLQQFIPGAVSTDNVNYARRSETALREALYLDRENWTATVLLGMLARNQNQPEQARGWYLKAAALRPRNADTWLAAVAPTGQAGRWE
jgi:Flp pilus assembly protein TadD